MSYPRQSGSIRMPMPGYGGYGAQQQQQQRPGFPMHPSTQQHGYPSGYPQPQQHQQQQHPSYSHHQQIRPTSSYPTYSQPPQSYASQPTPPYPTEQVQSMSMNNTHTSQSSTSYSTQSQQGGLQASADKTAQNINALIKDATNNDLEHLVNNEDKLIELVQDSTEVYTHFFTLLYFCLLYTSPSPRDKRQSRMPSSA